MRIAYIGHSYHQKTLSTQFIINILRKHKIVVDCIWDDSWLGGKRVNIDELIGKYDAFVFFQLPAISSQEYYQLPANITYIPMLDTYEKNELLYKYRQQWYKFAGVKFLNFSSALHNAVASHGFASQYVKYFPDPSKFKVNSTTEELKGFFWQRNPESINWDMIKSLTYGTKFSSFHLHMAIDPPHSQIYPSKKDIDKYNISTTEWFENKNDLYDKVMEAQVYFAPRLCEGIGMAFLEAMAMGKCVVSPDIGTMNEYILNGVNGLLYNYKSPQPLDFSNLTEIGRIARLSIEQGFETWQKQEEEIVEYIITPRDKIYKRLYPSGIDFAALARNSTDENKKTGWCMQVKQRLGQSRLRPVLLPFWKLLKK